MTLYELEQKLEQLRMHSIDDNTPVIVTKVLEDVDVYSNVQDVGITTSSIYSKAIQIII